jgi:hypothetical protein
MFSELLDKLIFELSVYYSIDAADARDELFIVGRSGSLPFSGKQCSAFCLHYLPVFYTID